MSKPRISRERRRLNQNSSMTSDQPKVVSRRLAPVTLAAASCISRVGSVGILAAMNEEPASQARTASMVYSGRTAMRARTAIANEAETSSWATSAAQDSRKAPPMMPMPNMSASTPGWNR